MSWARVLAILPADADSILIRHIATDYLTLKNECFNFLIDNSNLDLNRFNPLSKVTAGNPWAQQYDNQNKLSEIKLDVDRTYQETDFYGKNHNNGKSLINILFTFTKTHKLEYRQGMNELCAIIFYVTHQGLAPAEADIIETVAYGLFDSFMRRFGYADMFYQSSMLGHPVSPSGDPSLDKPISPLLRRCEKIFELLHTKDPRLHKHLVTHEISPNLFLLRWVRILFAREFPFDQTLLIWDFVFAHVPVGKVLPYPSIIDYIAVAMIMNIRTDLLQSDNSGCFTKLLKYPKLDSVGQLLDLAIKVRDNESGPSVQPPQIVMQAAQAIMTRRDKIITDLNSVIADLRAASESGKPIVTEIRKLEDIVNFIKK